MDFSTALLACKAGAKIARSGWNGKDMFVVYQAGYPDGIGINANTAAATGLPQGTVCRFLPYLMFRTAQGDFVPWLASQTDILATDWTASSEAGRRTEVGIPPRDFSAEVHSHVTGRQ